jgi:hypothetical protein
MADSTLDSQLFHLIDLWPGAPIPTHGIPHNGFDDADHHNVATPVYPIGTKIQVYNESAGLPGYSTFIYLKVGTQNASVAIAAKSVVVQDSATIWYEVTNDPDDCINIGGPVAVAISAMTNAYYGWFWCGGVCPEEYISGLGGNYATTNAVVAGPIVGSDLSADAVGFGPLTDTSAPVIEMPCGVAVAADA